ncbi:21273_t:CDS:2, partial [Entrophospora sp. SA101]
ALNLIPLFAHIKIPSDIELDIPSDESLTILSETKEHDLTVRFKRESDAFYLEAKRSVVAITSKVPYWILFIIVILGWNEFMVIITSPSYLILTGFFGIIFYVVWLLNLIGTVETFMRMIINEFVKVGKDKIKNSLEESGHPIVAEKLGYMLGDTSVVTKKEQ